MNTEFFIAKKIHFNKTSDRVISRPAVFVATLGVAVGLAVMILSVAVVVGFKNEIRDKVIGFGSHIRVANYDFNVTYETNPITLRPDMLQDINVVEHVRKVSVYATKQGILRTDNAFQGVVVKGVTSDFDWDFFSQNMLEGEVPALKKDSVSNDVLLSKVLSDKMGLKVGDSFLTYFISDKVRVRKFNVSGIYSTNFSDFDKLFLLADIHHVQKLNGWTDDKVSGLEITIDDYKRLDQAADDVYAVVGNRFDENGAAYGVQTIRELNPQIFSWLDLLDMNVWVILVLMALVAGFNMLSGLLILILEKTNFIGILKSMGAQNISIRKIFLYQAIFLIGKGMFWGNVVGILLCLLQKYTNIVTLDPSIYYLSAVPVQLSLWHWLLLNVGAFVVSVLVLVGPSYVVSKIRPAKSIRFE